MSLSFHVFGSGSLRLDYLHFSQDVLRNFHPCSRVFVLLDVDIHGEEIDVAASLNVANPPTSWGADLLPKPAQPVFARKVYLSVFSSMGMSFTMLVVLGEKDS
jgi:hypothetical protein